MEDISTVAKHLKGTSINGKLDGISGTFHSLFMVTQSVGAVEYTDCIYAEGQDSPNECPGYETKQSDGEAPVVLERWRMRSTLLLPSLSVPLWPEVVAPDWVLSIGQIELNCVLMLSLIVSNRTVLTFKLCT